MEWDMSLYIFIILGGKTLIAHYNYLEGQFAYVYIIRIIIVVQFLRQICNKQLSFFYSSSVTFAITFQICICKSLRVRQFTYVFFVLFLSKKTKLSLLVSLHEEVSIDFNFIYYLLLFLSLSLTQSLIWIIGNSCIISENYLSLFLSPKVPLYCT